MTKEPINDLDYKSGMLQSWNKFWSVQPLPITRSESLTRLLRPSFTGGYIEVNISLPGSAGVTGRHRIFIRTPGEGRAQRIACRFLAGRLDAREPRSCRLRSDDRRDLALLVLDLRYRHVAESNDGRRIWTSCCGEARR